MADEIPETPEQIRELLVWARNKVPDEKDLRLGTAIGAPHFLILGYLCEECGIDREKVREALVDIRWTEALDEMDGWNI